MATKNKLSNNQKAMLALSGALHYNNLIYKKVMSKLDSMLGETQSKEVEQIQNSFLAQETLLEYTQAMSCIHTFSHKECKGEIDTIKCSRCNLVFFMTCPDVIRFGG